MEVTALREIIKGLQELLELETDNELCDVISTLMREAAARLVARQRATAV